ncbi:hypothetical protein WJX84_007813 [Apatococcus fuscideae]|uniref:Uncharacterized protein n=1 Tax=Apatococcus fuscideae TaxID=2026836 RepID=A0AAW1TJK3_9CHLO
MEAVCYATSHCPFLRNVAGTSGDKFAAHLAVAPEQSYTGAGPAGQPGCPLAGLKATFRIFHDPEAGVVPLQPQRVVDVEGRIFKDSCPIGRASRQAQQQARSFDPDTQQSQEPACPFASISLRLPGPDHFLRKWLRQRRLDKQARQQRQPGGPGTQRGPSGRPTNGRAGPVHGHGTGNCGPRTTCTSGRTPGISSPPRSKQQIGSSGRSGQPYWKKYGPLGGLVPLGAKGELACPPAIVAARAFVAALPPVRELRPKALHVKMASIALVAAAANVPFGAWREHFDKFSLGWFVAVHATIPFIALLRKGVVMPRWAILLTITGAIAGQTVGSRLERRRLAALSSEPASHPPEPCLRATPVASLAMLPGDLYSSPVPSMDGNCTSARTQSQLAA